MLKKSLAIGLSVVMAAEVLTGCSGGSGTTETKAADTGKTEAASEAATEGGSGEEKTLTVFHYMGQSVKQQGLEKLEEEKLMKKIRKAQHLAEYEGVVSELFCRMREHE